MNSLEAGEFSASVPPEALAALATDVTQSVIANEHESLLPQISTSVAADPTIELVYVHESALANVAKTSFNAAVAVSLGIAAMRSWRFLGHNLRDAVDTCDLSRDFASRVFEATILNDREAFTLEGLLRRLAYQDRSSNSSDGYIRLADSATNLEVNCFDEGHHTIPFTKRAEDWMFSDNEPFEIFNLKIEAGEGPGWLRVIHGTDVTGLPGPAENPDWRPDLLVVPCAPTFPAATQKFLRQFSREKTVGRILTTEQTVAIEKATRRAYTASLLSTLGVYRDAVDGDPNTANTRFDEIIERFKARMRDPSFGHREHPGARAPRILPEAVLANYVGPHQWASQAATATPVRNRNWRGTSRTHDALFDAVGRPLPSGH